MPVSAVLLSHRRRARQTAKALAAARTQMATRRRSTVPGGDPNQISRHPPHPEAFIEALDPLQRGL